MTSTTLAMYLLLIGSYLHSKYEYQKVGIIGGHFWSCLLQILNNRYQGSVISNRRVTIKASGTTIPAYCQKAVRSCGAWKGKSEFSVYDVKIERGQGSKNLWVRVLSAESDLRKSTEGSPWVSGWVLICICLRKKLPEYSEITIRKE